MSKKHQRLKIASGMAALVVSVAALTFGVLAVLSDIIRDEGSFSANNTPTAPADALDISGSYRVYLNGSSTPESTNNVEMEPGDIAVVKATITNNGNASAWVRDSFFTDRKFLDFFSGEWSLAEVQNMVSTNDYSSYASTLHLSSSCYTDYNAWVADQPNGEYTTADIPAEEVQQVCQPGNGVNGMYLGGMGGNPIAQGGETRMRVLNGTGLNSQIESPANAPASLKADTDHDYDDSIFIGSNSYTVAYTVYYNPNKTTYDSWDEETQTWSDISVTDDTTSNFTATTQALQYRVNNSTMPIMVGLPCLVYEKTSDGVSCKTYNTNPPTGPWDVVVTSPIGL